MIFQFAMYFLSFLPLWISILFIDVLNCVRHNDYLWTEKVSILFIFAGIVVCSIIVWRWIKKDGKQNREKYTIKAAKEKRFITAEFLISYVVPLFAFDFRQWDGVILFLIFFVIFWILVYRHKYFCTNLALEIARYKVYECELIIGHQILQKQIVSRNELDGMIGETICTKKYNNDYHFETIQ